ncbi:MAG: riboflavin synthase [Planctomycetota bacterium]|nr:MAG: riboflavin synthase [Planctomycetota bacterium]
MFTGLVDGIARVLGTEAARGGLRLDLELGPAGVGARLGESICVAGCCLTVAGLDGSRMRFELSPESLRRTRFGALRMGDPVNVERSLRVGDRLGGHFLTGHVDGIGTVERVETQGDFALHAYRPPGVLVPLLIPKGSVGVEGVSLTVAGLEDGGVFTVALIPETLRRTTLGGLRPGDRLHMEGDLLGKFVLRQLELRGLA